MFLVVHVNRFPGQFPVRRCKRQRLRDRRRVRGRLGDGTSPGTASSGTPVHVGELARLINPRFLSAKRGAAHLIVVPAGDGEPRWIGNSRITLKATAAQTNGGYGLIVSEVARGVSAPLHIHHTAEEGIWVISGRILVRCGTDEFTLGPGGYTSMPRGVAHTFPAEQDTTMLGLITPGGTEGYFAEGGPAATTPAPPPPDLERLQQAAEEYQCELVGPPLTPRT